MRKSITNRLNSWNERLGVRRNINLTRMSNEAHSSRTIRRMRPTTCMCELCEALKYRGKHYLEIVNW